MSGEQKPRIVITGVGAVTSLGAGNDRIWSNLLAGKSGVRTLETIQTGGTVAPIGAAVLDYDPKAYLNPKQRKSLKVMARDIQIAVGAGMIAIGDSKIEQAKIDPKRFGINIGAAMIASELDELAVPVSISVNGTTKFDLKKWGEEGLKQLTPLWMLKYLPNMPACHLSIFYDCQGPNNTLTAGDASASLAMGEAFRIMQRGAADLFLTGGADSRIHPLSIVRLALLNRLIKGDVDPATAIRPFDKDRCGLAAGEGAGLMIFETLPHALQRNAAIYGELVGFGASCHPKDIAKAIVLASQRALKEAGITPADLGHIVPNGLSAVAEDLREAQGLADLLGPAIDKVPIVAHKGALGHAYSGSGAVEISASLLAMKHGVLPRTVNYTTPDASMPKLRILQESIDFPRKPFLAYSLSHSGQCGALVIKPFVGS